MQLLYSLHKAWEEMWNTIELITNPEQFSRSVLGIPSRRDHDCLKPENR